MNSTAALCFDSEHRLRSENLSFDIDVWYPKLKEYTFESVFIPLKRDEAQSILSFHDYSWRNMSKVLTAKDIEVLNNLESCINEALKSLSGENRDAFIRLCGRSPKDGEPLDRTSAITRYEAELARLSSEGYDTSDPNTKMIAITRVPLMKISSGADAMALLLTSERVFAEMLDWLKYGEPEQICLRRWEPELSLDCEFRVFVFEGHITAISQYDHYTHYPYLQALKKKLKLGIYRLWREIHPHVNDVNSSYVIDIAYLPVSDVFRLVELSPFTPCTGPALFHWQWDKEVLQGSDSSSSDTSDVNEWVTAEGDAALVDDLSEFDLRDINKIVFRLKERKDLHSQLGDLVELNWDMRWREVKPPFTDFYEAAREEHSRAAAEEETERKQQTSLFTSLRSWLNGSTPSPSAAVNQQAVPTHHYLFVYGTLKSGFHWHSKYLHPRLGDVQCISHSAVTVEPLALVVGDSGVPYLLQTTTSDSSSESGVSHCVKGELWRVEDKMLKSLDEYEGVGDKGYYSRITIAVNYTTTDSNSDGSGGEGAGSTASANVYVLTEPTADLLQRERIEEYTLDFHLKQYKPVRHIQVKQYKYIGQHSTWGKTNDMIDIVKSDKPSS